MDEADEFRRMLHDTGLSFYCRPQISEQADGTWLGRNQVHGWSVTAESREALIRKMREEDIRRSQDEPDYMLERYRVFRRSLETPIAGLYPVPREVRERVKASANPLAEINRYADQVDAQRGHGGT